MSPACDDLTSDPLAAAAADHTPQSIGLLPTNLTDRARREMIISILALLAETLSQFLCPARNDVLQRAKSWPCHRSFKARPSLYVVITPPPVVLLVETPVQSLQSLSASCSHRASQRSTFTALILSKALYQQTSADTPFTYLALRDTFLLQGPMTLRNTRAEEEP